MHSGDRTLPILEAVARYYTLTRAMIQDLCLPDSGRDGCVARKILNQLKHQGLINQTHCLVTNPHNGAAAPVYYPSRKGCEMLAQEKRDDRWLATCTRLPNWQLLYHWVQIARFHIVSQHPNPATDRHLRTGHFEGAEVRGVGSPSGFHQEGSDDGEPAQSGDDSSLGDAVAAGLVAAGDCPEAGR